MACWIVLQGAAVEPSPPSEPVGETKRDDPGAGSVGGGEVAGDAVGVGEGDGVGIDEGVAVGAGTTVAVGVAVGPGDSVGVGRGRFPLLVRSVGAGRVSRMTDRFEEAPSGRLPSVA